MVNGDIFSAYSQYFDILENVGSYSNANTARLLLASFIQDMKNSGFAKTLSEEDKKFLQKLEDCIQNKLCILPYTSTCMKKKVYKIFNGGYESCITYNKKAALKYPYAPNITLDIYSPSDTSTFMLGQFDFNDYIITEGTDYDLWFYSEENPGQFLWVNVTELMEEIGTDKIEFYQKISSDSNFGGEVIFYKIAAGNYKLKVDCSMQNGDNRSLALLNEGEFIKGKLYYKITQSNNTFDIGLIEVVAHGRNRNRVPNYVFVSHVSCQLDNNGYRTGQSVDKWKDTNLFSSTYNQVLERTTTNTSICTIDSPNWQVYNRRCALDQFGYQTGKEVIVYKDQNPYSGTYEGTKTEVITNAQDCPVNSPNWVEQSRSCQLDGNNNNTGIQLIVYKDTNPYSATYNQTKTEEVANLTACPTPSTDPVWEITSTTCRTETCTYPVYATEPFPVATETHTFNTGVADVIETNVNPASSNPGATRTSVVQNSPDCIIEEYSYLEIEGTDHVVYTYDGQIEESTDSTAKTVRLLFNYYINGIRLQNEAPDFIEVSASCRETGNTISAGSDPTGQSIDFAIPQNITGLVRHYDCVVNDILGNEEIYITITQSGDSDFYWNETGHPTSLVIDTPVVAGGGQVSKSVVSTAGNAFLDYTVGAMPIAGMTYTKNGSNLIFTIPANTGNASRNLSVTLTQNNTLDTIDITIPQDGVPVSTVVFAYSDDQQSKSFPSILGSFSGDLGAFTIKSKYNNNDVGVAIISPENIPSWLHVNLDTQTKVISISIDRNISPNYREYTINIKQSPIDYAGYNLTIYVRQLDGTVPTRPVIFNTVTLPQNDYWVTTYSDPSTVYEGPSEIERDFTITLYVPNLETAQLEVTSRNYVGSGYRVIPDVGDSVAIGERLDLDGVNTVTVRRE